jgi:hypothetical protein
MLRRYVEHAKNTPGVRFVTARELLPLYQSPDVSHLRVGRQILANHMAARQTFLSVGTSSLSAADALLLLLGLEPEFVDGPVSRQQTTYRQGAVPRAAFEGAKADAAAFIRQNHRLPAAVWIGSETLSLADFAATLAADDGTVVTVRKGNPEMEKYVDTDAAKAFDWVIHPEGFQAPELLELGRLGAWTLKPARLR